MNKIDIKNIEIFLNNEFLDYSIKYDHFIEDDCMEVTVKDVFHKGDVEFSFRCMNGNVEFYSIMEMYIKAETRQFWIELMSKLYE